MAAEHTSDRGRSAFDDHEYVRLIDSRGDFIRQAIQKVKPALGLSTALDAGAGVGFFVSILENAGLRTRAFEGRPENVAEARRRYPELQIQVGDVEDTGITSMGVSDLVLCFGLLYHLENPFRAIRNLKALTGKALLLESMCIPESEPWAVLRGEPNQEDQSLTDVAFYSTEGLIVKMLYRAGFSNVYSFDRLPEHEQFREGPEQTRRRTVLLATNEPLDLDGISRFEEPSAMGDPWQRQGSLATRTSVLVRKFLAKSSRGRYAAIGRMWLRKFPSLAVPVRLPFGAWWLARRGRVDERIMEGIFESAELNFAAKFLQAGMTVLDIGAHHGLYTLLASKRVGRSGRVFAFEPSPRERKLLEQHLRLNSCSNVEVESTALGSFSGTTELFLVEGGEDGCNSLKPPAVTEPTTAVGVKIVPLDRWLEERGNPQVDFMKLDVEGGELEILKGARKLLERVPRPVVFAEIEDIRTKAWGYEAKQIALELQQHGYSWFQIAADGRLRQMTSEGAKYDGNYVGCPEERLSEINSLIMSEMDFAR